jgi:protein-tyrosine phosphatase
MKVQLPTVEGPWPGRLVVSPRPRGGDWLDDEMAAWHAAGIGTIVSLLTKEEEEEMDLTGEAAAAEAQGMRFLSLPIEDRSVPTSLAKTNALIGDVSSALARGEGVVIHCRGGLGRAPLIASCLLATAGVSPDLAFKRIGAVRRSAVPETDEQREWVKAFAVDAAPVSPISAR